MSNETEKDAAVPKSWKPINTALNLYDFTERHEAREFCIDCFWMALNRCCDFRCCFLAISEKRENLRAESDTRTPTPQSLQHPVCLPWGVSENRLHVFSAGFRQSRRLHSNPQAIDTKVVVSFQYDFFCEKIFQLSVKRETYQSHFPLNRRLKAP